MYFPLMGQNTRNDSPPIQKDSLLNEITDINKKVQEVTRIDTIGGRAFRQMLDTYLNELSNQPIYQLNRNEKGLLNVPRDEWTPFDDHISFNDTVILNPAYLPVIFDGRLLPEKLSFLSADSSYVNPADYSSTYRLIAPDSTFSPEIEQVKQAKALRRSYYVSNPTSINYNGLVFDKNPVLKEQNIKRSSIFDDLLATEDPIGISAPALDPLRIKKSHWKFTGRHELKFTQSKISSNWESGGDSKYSILSDHKITLDYKKNKIKWNNSFEWRLELEQNPADKEHSINITNDYIKAYSVFGLEAYKKWSYSSNLEIATPLLSGFKINSKDKLRSFLAPLDITFGVGMNYEAKHQSKSDKYKNWKLSIDLSPLSLKYRYISDVSVINGSTGYGMKEENIEIEIAPGVKVPMNKKKLAKLDIGSDIKANMDWRFNRYMVYNGRFRFFTSYKKVLIENENKFTFELNRYLGFTASVYLRYNDEANKKGKAGYLQYNENFRFGINYTW
ncbi:DUF3078 domain-containing protein [Dysgonomonas sp. 25]|uniref:DUF3078 domain-containing protein n=1 Tax=Dysgonomonas sp. 25 TaxID=2302933 RepID=UPI0013D7284D|nr:DUF3078 domain-containing protein [Dysgonomonas sp. 25]